MSVPIRFYTVVVSEAVADAKVDGGAERLRELEEGVVGAGLIRWVCMSLGDADLVVKRLLAHGLTPPSRRLDDDIAVLDMMQGFLSPCNWLEVVGDSWEPKRVRLAPPQIDLFGEPTDRANDVDPDPAPSPSCGDGLTLLLEYVRSDGRICPMPIPWRNFWHQLTDKAGHWDRSLLPLILGQWYFTSDLKKQVRLQAQLEWADQLGLIWVADRFLRHLKAQDWHAPETPTLVDPAPEPWDPETEEDEE